MQARTSFAQRGLALACAAALAICLFVPARAAADFTYVTKWGTQGTMSGSLDHPFGVATDGAGNVYVADTNNNRIQKFSSSGSFITMWGNFGFGDGQFQHPQAVGTDSTGDVYVADTYNNRIQKFSSSGAFITKWGFEGSPPGQFEFPQGISSDGAGRIYVADTYSHRIQRFTSSGSYIQPFWGAGSASSADGAFDSPQGVATDSARNFFYVADTNNHRIQKFSTSNPFLTKWGVQGSGTGQFQYPSAVATDSAGNVYVADRGNHRIQEFSSSGAFITKWGVQGSGNGQFDAPQGVASDGAGNVYVADTNNNRIQKFREVYARPGSATPLRIPLVTAYSQCTSPNSTHVSPLALPSCNPPAMTSTALTMSSLGRGTGFVKLRSLPGNPGTPADEADVSVTASASDVLCAAVAGCAPGADYTGALVLRVATRLTDQASNAGIATVSDTNIDIPLTCTGTPGLAGGSCAVSTTLDTLVPGGAPEGKLSIFDLTSVQILDAGTDGTIGSNPCSPTCGSGDEATFLHEGVLLP